MKYKDYYKIMGLPREASADDIRKAYRRLARKYHPDVSTEANAEHHFKELNEAYEVLKDPEKRAKYDQLGSHWRAGEEFNPPPGWDFGGAQPGFRRGAAGFGAGFDFSDLFGDFFNNTARHRAHPSDFYEDMQAEPEVSGHITVSLEEAYHGTTQSLQFALPNGENRRLNVKIPAGVTQGQRIRLAKQGAVGRNGVKSDLYLQVNIASHAHYRLEGRDVYSDLPLTPWEAALGATVNVPTLGGTVGLKIAAGAQSGDQLRLKGRGLPGDPAGHHYVQLRVVVPAASTESARRFYEAMAREFAQFQPREKS
ncbi:DnaJ C-terminal domain-containing protein [Thioflexithrix psekupsensis]|uniref:Cytochrome C biogenesis protein n=1 Tax=Thioflexithrix psekupsensis TaxID=1570016 RepID=A0A251XBH3_9GAMM|nr:DnaJ C-terminal domain-containing protein [Thioflexithrix psekupsensis]OUD15719.1 cytochrome C biogenesis protein [Thioflexithrix psekupsensis]